MDIQNVFQRYEIKYLISKEQQERIIRGMKKYMEGDVYGRSTICNLYFDTDNYLLIRRSLEHPVYKEKLRLRSYGTAKPDSRVFMELKKKYKSVVYKRRIGMTEREAMRRLRGEESLMDTQIGREMDYFLRQYQYPRPAVFLSYEREAFYEKADRDFRVTFDENILWRDSELSLLAGAYGMPVLDEGQVLMEIKTGASIPLWMTASLIRLMPDKMFEGIFDNGGATVIAVSDFLICLGVSLFIGVFLALIYTYKTLYTKSFVITLAILPAVVCVVIMMVNGNVGAGVAVAGAFSLVRFRSAPGTAREIGTIFLAMGAGMVAGMGYLGYAVLVSLLLGFVMVFYQKIGLGETRGGSREKTLHITIPEDLDYTQVFDELLEKYTSAAEVVSVKTTNMGSLFKLTYQITLRNLMEEKELIDALRCRNGNLEINITRREAEGYEL